MIRFFTQTISLNILSWPKCCVKLLGLSFVWKIQLNPTNRPAEQISQTLWVSLKYLKKNTKETEKKIRSRQFNKRKGLLNGYVQQILKSRHQILIMRINISFQIWGKKEHIYKKCAFIFKDFKTPYCTTDIMPSILELLLESELTTPLQKKTCTTMFKVNMFLHLFYSQVSPQKITQTPQDCF